MCIVVDTCNHDNITVTFGKITVGTVIQSKQGDCRISCMISCDSEEILIDLDILSSSNVVSFWIFENFTTTNNTAAKISSTRISMTTIRSLFSAVFFSSGRCLFAPLSCPCFSLLCFAHKYFLLIRIFIYKTFENGQKQDFNVQSHCPVFNIIQDHARSAFGWMYLPDIH